MITTFSQITGGDYGQPASGDGTHQYVYATYPSFIMIQVGETQPIIRGASFPAGTEIGNTAAWLPVIAADPDDNASVFAGLEKLYRYTKSPTVDEWPVPLVPWGSPAPPLPIHEYISALAFSPRNHNNVYLGTSAGHLHYSTDKGRTWTQAASSGVSIGYIRALLVSSKDNGTATDTVYAGGGGYGSDSSVLISINGGQSYEVYDQDKSPDRTSENLETLVMGLCEAPNASGTLFAATESSVYRRDPADPNPANDGWRNVGGTTIPVINYWSCESVRADQVVRMSSWGRGIWDYQMASDLSSAMTASLPAPDTATFTISATNNGPDIQGDVIVNLSGDLSANQALSPLPQGCVNNNGTSISCRMGDLAVGQTASGAVPFNLMGRTGSITMHADFSAMAGAINDPDGTNDQSSTSIVVSTGQDLVPTAMTASVSGGNIVVADSVKNQGSTAAASFTIRFYLSADRVYQPGTDIQLACSRTVTSLAVNSSSPKSGTKQTDCPIGTPPAGQYYVIVVDDSAGVIAETNEANNTLATTTTLNLRADLAPTAMTATKSGSNLLMQDSVKNQGSIAAGSFMIRFYLSADKTFQSGTDIQLNCSRTVTSLAANASSPTSGTMQTSCPIGTPPPRKYYVIVVEDSAGVIAETNEANNTRSTTSTTTLP